MTHDDAVDSIACMLLPSPNLTAHSLSVEEYYNHKMVEEVVAVFSEYSVPQSHMPEILKVSGCMWFVYVGINDGDNDVSKNGNEMLYCTTKHPCCPCTCIYCFC